VSGDPFMQEMLSHIPKVRRVALRFARRPDMADDLVQDTVVRALQNRDRFQMGTNMGGWLCFICRNIFLSGKRRSWRSTGMDDDWARAIPGPDNPHHRLALKEVLEALQYLPAEHSEALLLIAEGLSYDEAAQVLGCEVGTVKSRVSRARDAVELFFNAA
jgi:RNA polymerase sigma-70 factor, ECF subfamily